MPRYQEHKLFVQLKFAIWERLFDFYGGGGERKIFRKNPGPNFSRNNIQDRVNSNVRFCVICK